jgi:SpoVK/Ycf46/Vps4 family AAA+-type ATPase
VLRVDDIYNLPDPVFLIEKLMIESAMAFIYGIPGCGKTFVALDLAFSLCDVDITHWWGRKINKHGPVLYISSEGSTDMKFRMQAWEKKTGRKINRNNFHFIRESMNFVDPSHIVKLIQTIKHEIENYCHEKPIAIFVDTVSRVLPGADENLQKDMTLYVQGCDAVRHAFGCAVVGIHHMAKGGGTSMRGSSVFEGSANVALHIEREKPAMTGTMTARKIKEAADGWEIPFELIEAATTPAPNKKDASAGFGGAQQTQKEPDMEMCRKMVQAIDDAWRGGYPWGRGKESDRNAADRLSDSFGLSVEVCQKYVNLWHKEDVIVTDTWGDKNNKKGLRKGKGL